MTTAAQRARTGQISTEAEQVQFGRMLATVFTALFVGSGWIIGATWYGIRYCAIAFRYGYRQGARIQRAPPGEAEERR